jgi:hypothetical protein
LDSVETLPLIGTVILKSMRSYYRAVSLLSTQRAYTVLRELNWDWGTITDAGQVCLALTEHFNLVVVKKFNVDDLCEKEFKLWSGVYKVGVLRARLLDSQCLIMTYNNMPFVFHCVERDQIVCFDFDVSNWSRLPSSGLLSDPRFDAWTTKIHALIRNLDITVDKVLNDAVKELARNKYVHGDLEWRHVGLLPVLNDDNEVVGMKYEVSAYRFS